MKTQKNWLSLIMLMLLPAMLIFTSCENSVTNDDEELTSEEATVQALTMLDESGQMGCGGCFTLVYPVTISLPDESEVTVNSREEIREALQAYFQANPPQGPRPHNLGLRLLSNLVFPYDVQLEDGEILTIADTEELRAMLQACGFEPSRPFGFGHGGSHGQFGGLNRCYNLVFPITIDFPDGTSEEAADREELRELIQAWREANPDATERPTLGFPFDVELQNGNVVTIMDQEDVQTLRENCGGNIGNGHGPPCFRIQYPVTIAFADGTTVEVDSREAAIEAIMAWRQANPDATERPEMVFPITIIYPEDGTTVTVNSQEELIELRQGC